MPPQDESENGVLQFQWGQRRGVGKPNKDVHFYESFIYDEESYSLYDNVYLFKEGDAVPYVGKLLKIWELPLHNKRVKRVKILWFFRPSDINVYLSGHASSEKELFLASGEGVGLSNVNPLEAIAGKCSVICTLQDERNSQPSKSAIEKADFIFSRFFDVGNCTVLETPPETIAEVELKFLLNHTEEQKPDLFVKLEAVDSDVFDKKPVKQLGESNDLVKQTHFSQNDIGLGTKKLTIKSDVDSSDNDDRRTLRPSDDLIKHAYDKTEKTDPRIKKRKYVCDGDTPTSDPVLSPKVSFPPMELAETKNNTLDHRSRWFADMPWKERLESAHKQGKLVFLDNLDPSYSSREMEELLLEALKIDCIVKLIPQITFQNPHYGQAYVICKSRNEAIGVVQQMDEKCLILSDGRAVSAKLGMLELPQKAAKFPGHLKVVKGRLQPLRVEHKHAVATSHCSQPNTIEFELALEWLIVLLKYQRSKEKLFMKQHGQLQAFMGKYSSK